MEGEIYYDSQIENYILVIELGKICPPFELIREYQNIKDDINLYKVRNFIEKCKKTEDYCIYYLLDNNYTRVFKRGKEKFRVNKFKSINYSYSDEIKDSASKCFIKKVNVVGVKLSHIILPEKPKHYYQFIKIICYVLLINNLLK